MEPGSHAAMNTGQYWNVELGQLNWANGPATYPFPTETAAMRFAAAHNDRRSAKVIYPDGREVNIP